MPPPPASAVPFGHGPTLAQSRTKKALLFNRIAIRPGQGRGLNKTAFVVRFWAGLGSLRPAAGPPPFGLRSPCAARWPLPRSGCVPGASPVGARRDPGRWRRLGLCWALVFRCRAASSPAFPRPCPSTVGRVLGLAVRPVRPSLRSASLRSRRGRAPDGCAGAALGTAPP